MKDIREAIGKLKEKRSYDTFGPPPDIAICSMCNGEFKIEECIVALDNEGWEYPPYKVFFCPVCNDEIDDWTYSKEQLKKYEEWYANNRQE